MPNFFKINTSNGAKTINLFYIKQYYPYGTDKTAFDMTDGNNIISHQPYEETEKLINKLSKT